MDFKYRTGEFQISNFNDGKPFKFHGADDEKLMRTIVAEIFELDHYKQLIDYCTPIKNPVILDLGAQVGLASIYFSQLKGARIVSVEPSPQMFHILNMNKDLYPMIEPVNYAATCKDEKRQMAASNDTAPADSLYYNHGTHFDIEGRTIETIMNEKGLTHIDALKVDIEGGEYELFLSPSFKRVANKIDFIIGESHYLVGIPQMIPEMLKSLGFKTEFLPIENLSLRYGYELDGQTCSIDVRLKTLFKASKIK